MSVPVIEHIAVYLNSLVNGITVANGYNYDLVAVRPTTRALTADNLDDKNVVITQGDPAEDAVVAGNIREWEQPFFLRAIVYEDSEIIDTKINKIRSDIEKALGVENASHTAGKRLDGKAEYLDINKPFYLEYEELPGVVVPVTVGYSVEADDPYSVA